MDAIDQRFAIGISIFTLLIVAFVYKEMLEIRSMVTRGTPTPSMSDDLINMLTRPFSKGDVDAEIDNDDDVVHVDTEDIKS